MKHGKYDSGELRLATDCDQERRRDQRLGGQLTLTFSGMDGNHMVIDTGTVTDLCQDGIGVCAKRPVKPDMELALLIDCPNSDDHMCIPEAHVAWATGDCFGVSIRMMKPDDQERLRQIFALARHQVPRMS